jgi:hypothetical protein
MKMQMECVPAGCYFRIRHTIQFDRVDGFPRGEIDVGRPLAQNRKTYPNQSRYRYAARTSPEYRPANLPEPM